MDEAWLIYWDGSDRTAGKLDMVVGILPATTDVDEVARHMERLYALDSYTLAETLQYASGEHNPYPAQKSHNKSGDVTVQCGHNPWLIGTLVRNLSVDGDEFGPETISWEETFPNGTVRSRSYTRSKVGSVSLEGV